MLTRILIVVGFFAAIMALPGCLDESDRAVVSHAHAYLNTLAASGDPAAVAARDELDALLKRSDSESAAITAVLGMLGLGGSAGALRLILRYRAVAVDIVNAIAAAKKPDPNNPAVYVIDKAAVRETMRPSTLTFVESIRAKIESPVIVEVKNPPQ